MNRTRRIRRSLAATTVAVGASALLAGTAAAVPAVTDLPSPPGPQGLVAAPNGTVYFVSFGGSTLHSISGDTISGQIVGGLGGPSYAAVAASGNIWVSGYQSQVTLVAGGAPTPFTLAPTDPLLPRNFRGIATTATNAYALDKQENNVWRINLANNADKQLITLGAIPGAPTGPEGIVASPTPGDDAVYVTFTGGGGGLARVTSAGANDFGPSIFKAYGITVGPDGAFYVTNGQEGAPGAPGSQPPAVTRVTTAGGDSFKVNLPGANPKGITTGPDGALWFAQSDGVLGRVTTTGSHSTVAIPGCVNPNSVAATTSAVYVSCFGTPDGTGSKIVKVVPDGVIPGPGPGPGTPPPPPPPAPAPNAVGKLTIGKKAIAGKRFKVTVRFSTAVVKNRVKVEYRSFNIRPKKALKKFKTLGSRSVTGKTSVFRLRIRKPGVYRVRVTYLVNGKPKVIKSVRFTVKPKRR